jgi:hypothetical protein
MQIDNELKCNDFIKNTLEKTYRLIYEQMDNKWQYYEKKEAAAEKDRRQLNVMGVQNADNKK